MSLIRRSNTPTGILRIWGAPYRQTVQLYTRQAGDAFSDPVAWQAAKMPVDRKPIGVLGGELPQATTRWLFVQQAQTVAPTERDRFVDAAGVTWQVETVDSEQFELCHVCQCTMAVPIA